MDGARFRSAWKELLMMVANGKRRKMACSINQSAFRSLIIFASQKGNKMGAVWRSGHDRS